MSASLKIHSLPFFHSSNVYRFDGISSKCHLLFSPLFDHGQKSNNINRCAIGQNRLCQIQDSDMENMSFSHDIFQVSHCRE